MIHTPKIQRAIRFAIKTHEIYQKQIRKGKNVAYITHPLIAGFILAKVGASEDVIIAGILHDTIEDSTEEKKVTKEMLATRFGEKVARLVSNVTEQESDLSWEERKKEALKQIATFDNDSLLVKSADVISNLSELTDDYKKEGDEAFKKFNAPKDRLIERNLNVIRELLNSWQESPLAEDLSFLRKELLKMKS